MLQTCRDYFLEKKKIIIMERMTEKLLEEAKKLRLQKKLISHQLVIF